MKLGKNLSWDACAADCYPDFVKRPCLMVLQEWNTELSSTHMHPVMQGPKELLSPSKVSEHHPAVQTPKLTCCKLATPAGAGELPASRKKRVLCTITGWGSSCLSMADLWWPPGALSRIALRAAG